MNKGLWNASVWLVFLGLALIAGGKIYSYVTISKMRLRGMTEGKVVDLVLREETGKSAPAFSNSLYPVIEFYANGKLYKEVWKEGSYPSRYKIGDKVQIRFREYSPSKFIIAGATIQEKLAVFLQWAGVILIGIGIIIFIRFALRG